MALRRLLRPDHAEEVIDCRNPWIHGKAPGRLIKLRKYRESGAREVWLVFPKRKRIKVYLFSEGEETPHTYTFSDKVPVHISEGLPEGKCEVDFSEITRDLPL